ncbi:MAG: cytochrome C oxidase subunit IV family protein [Cocleimonas sp.]|nr:cytochrome C oxidase subunit IV family protein [Cocleimonas sp.]
MNKIYNIHSLWLFMITLTLSTYALGKLGFSGITVVFILLLTVIIKGTLIIRDYMELRDVSLIWRVIMYGWLWSITLAIALIYIFSLN